MDRQLNINLAFTANTEAAKQSLQQLQQQLTQIATRPVSVGEKLTPQLQAASRAAAELKSHLTTATNIKTGALDFGKLTQSIKQSGMSLSEYGAKLQAIGPQGQQAFMALANSVAMAEVPMRRAGTALTGMLTTLKNTAKWQLSSSLLHGFISSVSDAYNYAQDLNESLNNIRIVTGYNIDQMSKFAAEANKAAKALSTTTTEYTNASLIYYQQGLSDAEVKARTDVTIKMANASRQSAEIVSDQLTAIWNNFDNGTKTLEYYADVITALGAATASSSEEISDGLEKFAAVAETVGLSYEYATAALATVTATTRQSADVVGTAFKTLFARLNDLKLGETLDDGTTLGQYTENLAKIGVNIKDTSGQLKDMDQILTETAAKWDQLGRDQQVALAKGVAGIRQYAQFIALMDNWDFMEENLRTVESSGGTLQKQADIYAESWEAAQDRVRAAAEKVYSSLFNDKFFIALTNGFGDLIDTVGGFIDSIGGLGGVLSTFGLILTKVFATQMADGFRNLVYNIKMSTDAGKYAVQQAKELEMTKLAGMMARSDASTAAEQQTKQVYQQELILQKELIANAHNMTEAEQQTYQTLLEQHRVMGQQSIELQKQIELLKDQASDISIKTIGTGMLNGNTFDQMSEVFQTLDKSSGVFEKIKLKMSDMTAKGKLSTQEIKALKAEISKLGTDGQDIVKNLADKFNLLKAGGDDAKIAMTEIAAALSKIKQENIQSVLKASGLEEGSAEYKQLAKDLEVYSTKIGSAKVKEDQLSVTNKTLKQTFKELQKDLQATGVKVQDWAANLSTMMSSLMSAGMLISSISGLMNTLEDPDASGWEKFGQVLTSVSMIAMSLTGVFKGISATIQFVTQVTNKETFAKIANTLASYLQERQSTKTQQKKVKEAISTKANAEAIEEETKEIVKNEAVKKATGKDGLSTGTFTKGKRAGQTWYKQGGQFISADKYASLQGAGGAGGSLLNPGTMSTLMGALGSAALVAGGIAVVAGAITLAVAQYNSYETAAKNAAEAEKMLNEELDQTKEEYSQFTSLQTGYEDAINKTKELTKGTAEYNEALLNANEQAMQLIEKYDLMGQYHFENGVIVFDEGALEEAQQKQLEKLANAQANSYMGSIATSQAQGEANRVKAARELDTKSDNGRNVGNVASTGGAGAAAGALIGSVIPVIGTAIGALIGGAIGLIGGSITQAVVGAKSEAELDAFDKLTQYVEKNGNDIFAARSEKEFAKMLKDANLEIDDKDLIKSLYANRDAVKELTLAEVARLEKEEAQWEAGFSAYNMANQQYTDLEIGQGYLNEQSSNYRDTELERVRNEVNQMFSGSNDDFWAKYLEMVYGQENVDVGNTQGENVRVRNLGGAGVTLQKLNAEGVWETVGDKNGLSETAAAEQLANAILLKEASEKMNFEQLEQLTKDLKAAGLTLEEDAALMDEALSQFGDNGTIDFSNFTASEILNIDTSQILDADFRKAMDKAVQDYKNNMTDIQREIINSDWYKGLAPEEQSLVWTLDIDEDDALNEVQQALEYLQTYLNANALTAGITVQNKAITAFEQGDFATLKTEYTSENSPYLALMPWEEFLQLSTDEMEAFLQSDLGLIQSAIDATTEAIEQNVTTVQTNAQNEYDNAIAIRDRAKAVWERLHTELTNMAEPITVAYNYNPNANYNQPRWDYSAFETTNPDALNIGWNYTYESVFQGLVDMIKNMGADDLGLLPVLKQLLQQTQSGSIIDEDAVAPLINILAPIIAKNKDADLSVVQKILQQKLLGYTDATSEHFEGFLDDILGAYISTSGYKNYARNYVEVKQRHDNAETWYEKTEEDVTNASSGPTNAATQQENLLIQSHQLDLAFRSQVESFGIDYEEFSVYRDLLSKTNIELENLYENSAAYIQALNTIALANKRADKGVKTLNANWEAWNKTIEQGNIANISTILPEINTAIQDILNIDTKDFALLPADFAQNNWNLIQDVVKGVDGALENLRTKAGQAILLEIDGVVDADGNIDQGILDIHKAIDSFDDSQFTIGIQLDPEKEAAFYKTCQSIINAAGMTQEQATAYFKNMGYNVKFNDNPQQIQEAVVEYAYSYDYNENGDPSYRHVIPIPKIVTTTMDVPTIETITPNGSYGGNIAVNTTANPEIKTTTSSPAENKKSSQLTKKTDIIERYKEWDDALDDVAYAMERVNKQADRLYGANRINTLKKQNELLLKQKELLIKKKGDVETDLTSDKNSLVNTAKVHGVNFKFDGQGNISNYTAEMTKLYNELAAVEATWADASKHASKDAQDAYEENVVQPIRDKIDEIKEALGIYTDTRELIEDLQNQIDDAFYEWQDNNYEQIHYKLELELEINDTELRMIDYYLNKIADDFYSMGEAAAKISTEKVDTLVNSLKDYESFENKLHAKFDAGDISQEKYVEGLKETFNGYLDNLEALQDLDKEMQHYYEDTLSTGAEELAIYTDRMEHLTSVLDHYQNIVTMMNGEMDFDNIGTVLEGKASTLNNEMKVAESNYAMLKAEQAAMQAAYDAADAEGKKYLKSSLDAINAQVDEAHEAMLSKTEEWAEAQRAIMENAMKKAAHEMEMAFTNNMGFDMVNNSLERLSSYSDEYLTKTNQIYETQKLMNTAQQAIDKTTNQAAKIRLENYNKEIKSLQDKNKLSKLELEIAEAKYDVLLAEIALEEAQKAKATVRLQRDSEGNYGYVYTADKESISAAEQDLADAQNALYNIGLEGANDYGQKLLDLQQKLADDLIALEEARAAGQYQTDEEYYAAKNRLISEYNNLFTAYSEQYTTALGIDASIQQEAWITAYDEMILKTEDWQIHVDEYTTLCEESYSHWREIVQTESDIVTDLLGNVSDAVKNVTDESNNLKDKIVKEVIPAIENEYAQVRTAVLAYESLRAGLQLTIQRYEELARAIQETMRQQALLEGQTNTPEVPGIPEEEVSSEESDNKIGHSEMMDLVEDIMVHGSYENDPARTKKILDAGYSAEDRTAAQMIINDIAKNESAAWRTGKDWDKVLNEYTTKYGYNTGGYTGEWGPEGRLAMLHQKELILNASDTQNFLMATEILRSIADIIDINSLHSQISQLTPVSMTTSGQQTLEQAVSIEAHFPNVTDRNEIEEAFNNLINTASQYANRKF